MRKLSVAALFGAAAFALPMLFAPTAHAGLSSCGNINVSAEAKCEAKAPGIECEGSCSGHATAACYGKLSASCSSQGCTLPTAECEGSCSGDCSAKCQGGNFSCEGDCTGTCEGNCGVDCEGSCTSQCSSSANQAQCKADCKGQCSADCKGKCSGQCKASCTGTPVECSGQCQASCKGSCKVKTDFKCQAECQASGEAKCEADMEVSCKAACKTSNGALYCDGSYVDSGGNFQDCVNSLNAVLNVKVSASASCSGNSCEAEAAASCGGSTVSRSSNAAGWPIAFGAIGALGLVEVLRRRRNRK